jgi:hypothetical protein
LRLEKVQGYGGMVGFEKGWHQLEITKGQQQQLLTTNTLIPLIFLLLESI